LLRCFINRIFFLNPSIPLLGSPYIFMAFENLLLVAKLQFWIIFPWHDRCEDRKNLSMRLRIQRY
jgi:hypothetical protein